MNSAGLALEGARSNGHLIYMYVLYIYQKFMDQCIDSWTYREHGTESLTHGRVGSQNELLQSSEANLAF